VGLLLRLVVLVFCFLLALGLGLVLGLRLVCLFVLALVILLGDLWFLAFLVAAFLADLHHDVAVIGILLLGDDEVTPTVLVANRIKHLLQRRVFHAERDLRVQLHAALGVRFEEQSLYLLLQLLLDGPKRLVLPIDGDFLLEQLTRGGGLGRVIVISQRQR